MAKLGYKSLMRVAALLTVAWVGWTLYDSSLVETTPAAHELAAATKYLEDGLFAEALEAFEVAEKLLPGNIGINRGKAQSLMRWGSQQATQAYRSKQAGNTIEAQKRLLQSQQHFDAALTLYDEAIRQEQRRPPENQDRSALGVSLANRGILKDQMGDYQGALLDYESAINLEPEVTDGPGLLTRFMRNQSVAPPTVADRARYLKGELSKPEAAQRLRQPEIDAQQRAYKMD